MTKHLALPPAAGSLPRLSMTAEGWVRAEVLSTDFLERIERMALLWGESQSVQFVPRIRWQHWRPAENSGYAGCDGSTCRHAEPLAKHLALAGVEILRFAQNDEGGVGAPQHDGAGYFHVRNDTSLRHDFEQT